MKFQWEYMQLTPDYRIPLSELFQKPVWQPDALTGKARFQGSVPVGSMQDWVQEPAWITVFAPGR